MQIHRRSLCFKYNVGAHAVMGCKLIPVVRRGHIEWKALILRTVYAPRITVRNSAPGPKFLAHICMRDLKWCINYNKRCCVRWGPRAAHLISLNGSVKLIQSKGPANARLLSANACD